LPAFVLLASRIEFLDRSNPGDAGIVASRVDGVSGDHRRAIHEPADVGLPQHVETAATFAAGQVNRAESAVAQREVADGPGLSWGRRNLFERLPRRLDRLVQFREGHE